MIPRRPIQAERLELEPATIAHAPALFAEIQRSRAELARWLAWVEGNRFDDTLLHLAGLEDAWLNNREYGFVVVVDGAVAGLVALRRTPNDRDEADMGYWLGTAYAGRGLMTEAATGVVEFAFRTVGLDRVELRAHVDNRASQRVAEKTGMHREGRLRGACPSDRGRGDAFLYGLLPADPRVDTGMTAERRPEGAAEVTEPDFSRGLVTAVAQDEVDGAVLMVAHMNEEAYRRTRESGNAWFWSRSRDRLWQKGETSGNVLAVRSITLDCDGDAVLLRVSAAGPACHTGARSCFHNPA